jgi:hypothetical protein
VTDLLFFLRSVQQVKKTIIDPINSRIIAARHVHMPTSYLAWLPLPSLLT